jgi:hypothetical protein
MTRLPPIVDFDDTAFPELNDIFRNIDLGIAAIVAADPTMRPKPASKRRRASSASSAPKARGAGRQRAAA